MATGDKILSTKPTNAMNKIKEMATKWGVSIGSKTFPTGQVIYTSDPKDMYNWLVSGKSKSGWTGTVPTALNATQGTNITDVFDLAYSTAESIRTYCACNCNYCSCNCARCSCQCDQCCNDSNDQ